MSYKLSNRNKHKRRTGELWTSNNRVLNASGAKKFSNLGRNPNFDTEETKLLIQLWGDPKVQRTLITSHKKHAVICQLSAKMQDYGYYRSAEEITTRIKNLKCFYNRLKKDMESSPNGSIEPTWKHFAEMDAIMTRPIFSVRPNEVPAPSLKYQLEQKQEERQERKRKAMEEGSALSDSEEDLEDMIALSKLSKSSGNKEKHEIDDGIIPDVEVDFDIADEAYVALANAAEKTINKRQSFPKSGSDMESSFDGTMETDEQDLDEDRLCIKEEEFESVDHTDISTNVDDADKSKSSEEALDSKPKDAKPQKEDINSKKPINCNENTNDSCVALVIPKDEPIDVDAEDDRAVEGAQAAERTSTKASNNVMTTIGEMLKFSQNNMVAISSAGNILIPVSSLTTNSTNTATKVMATLSNASPTSRVMTPTTNSQQAKISLVPTNFLMQPKTIVAANTANVGNVSSTGAATLTMPAQSLHLLQGQMPNARILSGTPTNAGIVTTGPGGMKVLLVNAEQAAAATASGKHSLSSALGATNLSIGKAVIPLGTTQALLAQQQSQQQTLQQNSQSQQQQQQQQQQRIQMQKQQKHQQQQQQKKQQEDLETQNLSKKIHLERERMARREEIINKRESTGIRILLRQLLNAQTENNEIQQKRLCLERERFDFEKNIAERFLSSLPAFFASQQQPQQPPQQFIIQQAAKNPVNMTQTAQLRLNPPKLVFATTAIPATTVSTTPNSVSNHLPVISTSIPKDAVEAVKTPPKPSAEMCAQLNDFQLITPKVESED